MIYSLSEILLDFFLEIYELMLKYISDYIYVLDKEISRYLRIKQEQ